MNASKVPMAVVLFLLASAAAAQAPCSLSVTPLQQHCVLDSQGQPIYAWTLTVTDTASCSGTGTLNVLSSTLVPSSFSIATNSTSNVSMLSFTPVTGSVGFGFSACGLMCQAKAVLTSVPGCDDHCIELALGTPVCSGASGSQCTYTLPVTVTNHTGVSSFVKFIVTTGSFSPSTATVPPGTSTLQLTLQAPCGASGFLGAQLFPGGPNAPGTCEKRLPFQLPGCACFFDAMPQIASLCAPDSTQVNLQPPPSVPAGDITWSSTTNCPPPGPPWTTLSGGSSWYTLGLNQTTCFQASIQGVNGCPSPVLSTVAQVQVTPPAPAGPIQCTLQGGGACPAQMCAPVNLALQTPPTPSGCTRTWEQDAGLGWQPIGITGSSYNPPPLTTTQCSSPARFRSTITCAPCMPTMAEADFELFELSPLAAGTLTATKLQICADDDDVINLTGFCPADSIQWQSSNDGTTWSDIAGALGTAGPTTWFTNKIFNKKWYRVKVKNGPCTTPVFSPSVAIAVMPQPTVTISAGGNTQFCAPGSVVLTATTTGGSGTYHWFKDGLPYFAPPNASSITVTQSGNYSVEFWAVCGKVKSNLIKVFASKIVAAISGPCGACPPQQCIALQGFATGGLPAYTYSWNWTPGNGTSVGQALNQCPTVPTTYTLTVKDALNCQKTVTQSVGICPKFKANAGVNRSILHWHSTVLGGSPTATGGQTPYTYVWTPATGLNNPNIANPVATPSVSTTYTVTVTAANGCQATAHVTVKVH